MRSAPKGFAPHGLNCFTGSCCIPVIFSPAKAATLVYTARLAITAALYEAMNFWTLGSKYSA